MVDEVETPEGEATPGTEDANPFEGFQTEMFKDGQLQTSVPTVEDAEEGEAQETTTPSADDDAASESAAEDDPLAEFSDPAPADPAGQAEPGDDPVPDNVQRRFDELTARRHKAERRLEESEERNRALEARIEALEKGEAPTPKDTPSEPAVTVLDAEGKEMAEPKPEDFEYGEIDPRYQSAVRSYERALMRAEFKAERETEQKASAAAQKAQETGAKWEALGAEGEKKHDDFKAVVLEGAANRTWALSETMAELIPTSDVGVDIAYHLASNPLESARVAGLPPVEQARYFGRLEAAITAREKAAEIKKKPGANPPPRQQPRGAGGRFTSGAKSNDFAAFEAEVAAANKR